MDKFLTLKIGFQFNLHLFGRQNNCLFIYIIILYFLQNKTSISTCVYRLFIKDGANVVYKYRYLAISLEN